MRAVATAMVWALLAALAPAGSAQAAAVASTRVKQRDSIGDVADARGDVVWGSAHYRGDVLILRARLRDAGSAKTASWQRGGTAVSWYLDTSGDKIEEVSAWLFNNGRDRLVGQVRGPDTYPDLRCKAAARQKGDVFSLRIRSSCINAATRVRLQVAMFYDRSVRDRSDRSLQVDLAPEGLRWSGWATRPARFAVEARRGRVPYGEQFAAYATFTDYWTQPNAPVSLYRRADGAMTWEHVGDAIAGASGYVSFPHTAERSADYQWRFNGSKTLAAGRSPIIRLNVTMAVAAESSHTHAAQESPVEITGRVEPASPGTEVRLQRQTKTGWATIATSALTAESLFHFDVAPGRTGDFVFRVRAPGDAARRAGASAHLPLRVYDAEIIGVEPSDPAAETLDLNSEYISVRNSGTVAINLDYWLVQSNLVDAARIPYQYTYMHLPPGAAVQIHTGSGEASVGHLYLGRRTPMWPPAGIARLYDAFGDPVAEHSYTTQ